MLLAIRSQGPARSDDAGGIRRQGQRARTQSPAVALAVTRRLACGLASVRQPHRERPLLPALRFFVEMVHPVLRPLISSHVASAHPCASTVWHQSHEPGYAPTQMRRRLDAILFPAHRLLTVRCGKLPHSGWLHPPAYGSRVPIDFRHKLKQHLAPPAWRVDTSASGMSLNRWRTHECANRELPFDQRRPLYVC